MRRTALFKHGAFAFRLACRCGVHVTQVFQSRHLAPPDRFDSARMPQLTAIARFPVKGLGPDWLTEVDLEAGHTLPDDRAFAIEHGQSPFDPAHPAHVKKKHFLMLAGQAGLARLSCRYCTLDRRFTVSLDGRETSVILDDAATHPPLFDLLNDLLGEDIRGGLRIVHAPGQAMTDIPEPHISLINAASVRDLSETAGKPLDPVRFRGNVLIDGLEPWAEFGWTGQDIRIGEVRLRVERRIGRCAATSVNLATGTRDIDVPKILFEHYGHTDCGLYLDVKSSGRIALGDPVEPIG